MTLPPTPISAAAAILNNNVIYVVNISLEIDVTFRVLNNGAIVTLGGSRAQYLLFESGS